MKKNEIFTIITSNGVEIAAICLKSIGTMGNMTQYLCYSQNRLFTMTEFYSEWIEETGEACKSTHIEYGEILLEHVNLPDYDVVLEDYHQQHEKNINTVRGFGYTEAEAENILDGKNADGTNFVELPF